MNTTTNTEPSSSQFILRTCVMPLFQELAFIVTGIGAVFSLLFHVGTKERPSNFNYSLELTSAGKASASDQLQFTWKSWLKEPGFYRVRKNS